MKIYTRTGDDGTTSLFAGGRVYKDDLRVEAYGTVDELNSYLGMARSFALPERADAWLNGIQRTLFIIGADLATPLDAKADWLVRLDAKPVQELEQMIDSMDNDLETLKAFILPGGSQAAATLHIARTVCRRAERITVTLAQHHEISGEVIIYLNRLSDYLFTLARWVNQQAQIPDVTWTRDE